MELFTRKSTGLVRQGRWIDSFVFNSSASFFLGPLVFALSSLFYFRGDDLLLAELIALAFAFCIAAMYAMLTSLMPRSGGDYIFNSRILHPALGFSFNFSLTAWQLFSAAFTLFFIFFVALAPGLEVLSFYLKAPYLFNVGQFVGEPLNSFILASCVNVVFSGIMLLGIRRVFSALNLLWAITLIGSVALIISLAQTSTAVFANNFNQFFSVLNATSTANAYSTVISLGAAVAPNASLTAAAIAICASSVIWVFYETYVSGEIRGASSFRRNLSSMAGAACLNGALFAILIYVLFLRVGPNFVASITALSGSPALPSVLSGPLQSLTAVFILATGNAYVAALLIAAITLGYTILLLPPLYLQPIRSIFAWSFDRVLPTSFSNVSTRFHSPLYATIAVFAVIEAGLALIFVEYNSLLGIFFSVIIAPAFSCVFPTALSSIAASVRGRSKVTIGPSLGRNTRGALFFLGAVSLAFILFMSYVFIANESYFFVSSVFSPIALIAINFVLIPVGAMVYFVSFAYRKRSDRLNLNSIASVIPPE